MTDYLIRIIAQEAGVRAIACLTTDLVNELCARHATSPTAAAAFGRALTGGALLGALLKAQQRLAIKFEGDGPLQKLVVEADSVGHMRGYPAVPDAELRDDDGNVAIVDALGRNGFLTVIKDLRIKNLAEGMVPLVAGNIDDDLTHYLAQSEQIPSLVELGALPLSNGRVAVAGGLLAQSIPPHNQSEDLIARLKDRVQELPPLEELLYKGETPETILEKLFTGIEYETLEKRDLAFRCTCSRERSEQALLTLGYDEVNSLFIEEGEAVVDCHFCHERYLFDQTDLEILLIELEE